MEIAWGATRMVILTKRWAFKLPRPTEWRLFLNGLLGNMQERQFATTKDLRLCPVAFALWGGWLVVMPRARPLTDDEWIALDNQAMEAFLEGGDMAIPAEAKRSSFGMLAGTLVAVDYG